MKKGRRVGKIHLRVITKWSTSQYLESGENHQNDFQNEKLHLEANPL